MPLDPYLLSKFDLIRPWGSFAEMFGDPAADTAFRAFSEDPEPWVPPVGVTSEEREAPGPHGPVRVRIYRPEDPAGPALLWMHGGGFAGGDIDMPESSVVSPELASRAGAVVVTVDYRLARGGVKYPVPLDDVVAAWEWFVAEAPALGADASRLSIGGASAGANLATAATMRIRDEGGILPASMLLAYPLVHDPVPPLPDEVLAEMAVLPALFQMGPDFHEATMMNYLGRTDDIPAGVAPGNFDLTGMPPAFLAPDEYDALRPSAYLFAEQLRAVGVRVELELAEGMMHGHLNRTPSLPAVDRTLDFFAGALRA